MKKILFAVIMLCGITSFAEAKIYVISDKATGVIKGVCDISDEAISEWNKQYSIKETGEDFRGKHSYEIKLENGKLRRATKEEIDAYEQQNENEAKESRKQNILKDLGITNADLAKIKAL